MYAKTSYKSLSQKDTKTSPSKSKTDLLYRTPAFGSKGGSRFLDRKLGLDEVDMGKQKVNTILSLAGDPSEAQSILRKELLLERSFGSKAMGTAEDKHYYATARITITPAEQTIPLCRVTGGTATNTRTTNAIAVKGFKFRYILRRIGATGSTTAPREPTLTLVFWRDKIPATVGTAPTIIGTDANPPASTTLMFSRLGSADERTNAVAIRNPVTALDYHIYEVRHHQTNPADMLVNSTSSVTSGPISHRHECVIDTHRVSQIYATYAATAPDVNDLYMTIYSDIDYTNIGYLDELEYSIDTEFEDIGDQ